MTDSPVREIVLKWVELYNDGTPEFYGSDRFLELYHEDVDWRELPTQYSPDGRSGDLSALREGVRWGQAMFVDRRIDLHDILEAGDQCAVRYTWEGTVATAELPVPKGTRLRAAVAQFIAVRDGKISASTEYLSWLPPEPGQ